MTERQAKAAAKKLARRLNTHFGVKSFEPSWRDNLGWYFTAGTKHIHVFGNPGLWRCLIGEGRFGISGLTGSGKTPHAAVMDVLEKVRRFAQYHHIIFCEACDQINLNDYDEKRNAKR